MTATTKRILSELQRLDRGEPVRFALESAVYPPAVAEEVRRLLDEPTGDSAPEKHTWEVPASQAGNVLDALLILTVRGLK